MEEELTWFDELTPDKVEIAIMSETDYLLLLECTNRKKYHQYLKKKTVKSKKSKLIQHGNTNN